MALVNRVTVQQPCLAKYRLGFFKQLAAVEGLRLKVAYGDENGISNVAAEGFDAEFVSLSSLPIAGISLFGHRAQWTYATRKQTDVLVLAWNTRFLTLVPSLLRAKCLGVKTILWGHGVSKNESWLRSEIRCFVTRFADRVLFYDPYTLAESTAGRPGLRRKSHFASNAIDEAPH